MKNITVFLLLSFVVLLSVSSDLVGQEPYKCTRPDGRYIWISLPMPELPAHLAKWGLTCAENYGAQAAGSSVDESQFESTDGRLILMLYGPVRYDNLSVPPGAYLVENLGYGQARVIPFPASTSPEAIESLNRHGTQAPIQAFYEIAQDVADVRYAEVIDQGQGDSYLYRYQWNKPYSIVKLAALPTKSPHAWYVRDLHTAPEIISDQASVGMSKKRQAFSLLLIGGGLVAIAIWPDETGAVLGGGVAILGGLAGLSHRDVQQVTLVKFRVSGTVVHAATGRVDGSFHGISTKPVPLYQVNGHFSFFSGTGSVDVVEKNIADSIASAMDEVKEKVIPKLKLIHEGIQDDLLLAELRQKGGTPTDDEALALIAADENAKQARKAQLARLRNRQLQRAREREQENQRLKDQ